MTSDEPPSISRRETPHGTPYRYREGCRCEDCVAALRRDSLFRGHDSGIYTQDQADAEEEYRYERSHGIPEGDVPTASRPSISEWR